MKKLKLFGKLISIFFLCALATKDLSALTISKSFTATGSGAAIAVSNGDSYTFSVSGTFVGTVILERSQNGGQFWQIIKTVSAALSSTTFRADLENSGIAQYRFRCSAYTSGTIVTSLGNAVNPVQSYYDQFGSIVFQITENGIIEKTNQVSSLGAGICHFDSSGIESSSNVVNADVDAAAAIDYSKLAALPSGNFLVGNGSNVAVGVALSGDATLSNAGALTIAASAIVDSKVSASAAIAGSKINPVFGAQAISGSSTLTTTGRVALGSALSTASIVDVGDGVNPLSGVDQWGVQSAIASTSAGTTSTVGFISQPQTSAAAYTTAYRAGYESRNPAKGSGSTITRDIGLLIAVPNQGTNNAILSDGTAFSGNFAINLASTNASSLAGALTVAGQFIGKGTATNDSAAAGNIGEVLSQSRLRSAASSATTATTLNVTASALALTAGDWDVEAIVGFNPAATTSVTRLDAGISTTSATLSGTDTIAVPDANGQVRVVLDTAANVAAGDITLSIARARVSLTGTTNYFLVAQGTFAVSTLTVYGSITARRVR